MIKKNISLILNNINNSKIKIVLFITFFLIFNIANAALEPGKSVIPCDGPDCNICSVFQLIANVVSFLTLKIAAPVGIIVLMYGGFMMIAYGANPSYKEKGLEALWAAILGLVITFAAWMIVNTILGAIADKPFYDSWYKFAGC